jgi:hypothetical protein
MIFMSAQTPESTPPRRRPVRLVGLLSFVLLLAWLGTVLYLIYDPLSFFLRAEAYDARVVEFARGPARRDGPPLYIPVVEVTERSGERVRRQALPYFEEPAYEVGAGVKVLCVPAAARDCVRNGFWDVWGRSLLLLVLLLGLPAFSFAGRRIDRRLDRNLARYKAQVEGRLDVWKELPPEWIRVCEDYGRGSERLRASIDVLAREVKGGMARPLLEILSKHQDGTDVLPQHAAANARHLAESWFVKTKATVKAWRSYVSTLEGEGPDALPPGVSHALPLPASIRELVDGYHTVLLQMAFSGAAFFETLEDSPLNVK